MGNGTHDLSDVVLEEGCAQVVDAHGDAGRGGARRSEGVNKVIKRQKTKDKDGTTTTTTAQAVRATAAPPYTNLNTNHTKVTLRLCVSWSVTLLRRIRARTVQNTFSS